MYVQTANTHTETGEIRTELENFISPSVNKRVIYQQFKPLSMNQRSFAEFLAFAFHIFSLPSPLFISTILLMAVKKKRRVIRI